jgi:hypothetical protein
VFPPFMRVLEVKPLRAGGWEAKRPFTGEGIKKRLKKVPPLRAGGWEAKRTLKTERDPTLSPHPMI